MNPPFYENNVTPLILGGSRGGGFGYVRGKGSEHPIVIFIYHIFIVVVVAAKIR
jgi:hypothetical protein